MPLVRTALIALFLVAFLQNAAAQKRPQSIVKSRGAVATDGRCSGIGMSVLRQGGNAIDASVAAALFRRYSWRKAIAYDSRETAPLGATEDMYGSNPDLKKKGALSAGVPGKSRVYTQLGNNTESPWKQLVTPAEKLAEGGFRISKYLYMQLNATRVDHLHSSKSVNMVQKHFTMARCGIITLKDLQSYRVKVTKPLSANILGYELLGMPPPSSGGAAMMLVLNILSQYGIPSGVSGSLGVHRLIKFLKHAVVSDMLSPEFAKDLKKKINDDKTFDPKYYGGIWNQIDDHGTSHLSIIDRERNAVSMTSTINGYFGAVMLSPSTGIVLNNEMDDFSVPAKSRGDVNVPPPAPANFIRPETTIVLNVTHHCTQGIRKTTCDTQNSYLGSKQRVFMSFFLESFFLHMDPLSSVLAPRIYHQLIPNRASFENWTTVFNDHFEVPKETRVVLEKKGHVLTPVSGGTIAQFIVQESDGSSGGMSKLVAVSDPRKGGFPRDIEIVI
ncbi:hypothetical protein Bca52824_095803 [Brassica carinata]|uniref:Gamma-glutamyltransferase n=1 Tax=Brassica carinata TaxID=52824 RepID=A0A8X7TIK5_BRACI|nr:hypothetical protein Bca52824_095803 [Brassica carinata]